MFALTPMQINYYYGIAMFSLTVIYVAIKLYQRKKV